MKLHKLFTTCVAALLLSLLSVPVYAQTSGSLLIRNVKEPAVLYLVADEEGLPEAEFAPVLSENLTEGTLSPTLARTLYTYAKENALEGNTQAPEEEKINYGALEKGYYLVGSTAQEGEFAPFLISVPMTIGGKSVYDIQAQPKTDDPDSPIGPIKPGPTEPNIPQTGNIQWPKYLLLTLGGIAIVAGFGQILWGRRRRYE